MEPFSPNCPFFIVTPGSGVSFHPVEMGEAGQNTGALHDVKNYTPLIFFFFVKFSLISSSSPTLF